MAIAQIRPDWTVGTLSLVAGSDVFTTQNSTLEVAVIQAGDSIITASGDVLIIASITGQNSGTLMEPCPASAAGAEQPLRIRYQPDGSRYNGAAADLIQRLSSGNLSAFSQLAGGIDKVPYFTAPGVFSTIDLSALGNEGGLGWDAIVSDLAGRAAYDSEPEGFRVLVADIGAGRSAIYQRVGVAGTWSFPVYITGPMGATGAANKLTIGSVADGTEANATITGTSPNQFLNLVLPRGAKGDSGDITPEAIAARDTAIAARDASQSSATAASGSSTAAATSATNAGNSATSAGASATTATQQASAASLSAIAANTSAQDAADSEDVATTAALVAAASESAAAGSATAAASSASAANSSKNDAADSAASAYGSEQDAAQSAADALTTAGNVQGAVDDAYLWANQDQGVPVVEGSHTGYSSYHWSKVAETAAGGGIQSVNGKTGSNIDLDAVDVGAVPDTYIADIDANTGDRHNHTNKAILDATTASYTTAQESKLAGIAAGAQVNTVTSVAGRTGAVALAKADVGLGNVDNTSDANKPISTATQAALDNKAAINLSNVTQVDARSKVGTGSMAYRNVTISTADPSGGADGDVWMQVE